METQSGSNLVELAYQAIREAMRRGTVRPGERLREARFAKELGISRTPIRSAIARLITEGLLTPSPTQGVVVTELNHDQVIELYAVLEVLEAAAAGLAASNASEEDHAALLEIHEKERTSRDDVKARIALNDAFHARVYSSARNRYLLPIIERVNETLRSLPASTLEDAGRRHEALEEHFEILSAMRQRDADLASKVAREHVRQARRLRMRALFSG